MVKKKIPNELQKYIDKEGWSKAETARRANISEKTLNKLLNFENTRRNIKVKVAKALSIDPKKIFINDSDL